jgi:hypothetical protein
MATNTYVALDTKTITSSVASVSFTSIPQTYTDLVLVCSFFCTNDGVNSYVAVNGSTAGYSKTNVAGSGSSATSGRQTSTSQWTMSDGPLGSGSTTNPMYMQMQFQNYANTTTYKTMLARQNIVGATYNGTVASVNLWANTAAINRIDVYPQPGSGNVATGSTFTLYGIANSNIGAPKAFGGTITQDATYTYHTFGASGTFTPQQSLTVDYLVVAGGGGGGGTAAGDYAAGGGGAGGYLTSIGGSAVSVTATNYSITVGAGGAGTSGRANGTAGSDSVFNSITATGGGYGAGGAGSGALAGGAGGSGGGGRNLGAGGAGTSGQGFAGGAGNNNADTYPGGGGGGAGAVGQQGNASGNNYGGIGLSTNSTWATVTGTGVNGYYAGGGGGGIYTGGSNNGGGTGGGGAGGIDANATNGSPLSGGGGGGSGSTSVAHNGGSGGSGVVIIRYAN